MKSAHKLFESFGELLYVVAMADGSIQKEEMEVIEKRLADHKWGDDIKWSFNYEVNKQNDVNKLYKKVIAYCEDHGPDEEYEFLLDVLEEVSRSSNGIVKEEREVMDNFTNDLIKKFREDIERINKR
ncbi:TerB family tellurite resistance protein [Tenacibaculum sp. 190524A02b]|uniref:TerB family tellurite resistance protein n=1 Tax=Tenacibaculum vairaonense TaxID=3137860 RepID=A0ABP1FD93_9FLAO